MKLGSVLFRPVGWQVVRRCGAVCEFPLIVVQKKREGEKERKRAPAGIEFFGRSWRPDVHV